MNLYVISGSILTVIIEGDDFYWNCDKETLRTFRLGLRVGYPLYFSWRKNELRVGESKQEMRKSRVSRIAVFTDRFRVKLLNGTFSSRGELADVFN